MLKHKPNNYKIYIVLCVLAFCALIFYSRYNAKSDELTAMLESSVATMQLQTGHEINRRHQDNGATLGKPIYAEFIVEYKPTNNYTQKNVYDEIIAILGKNNWEKEELSIPQPDYYIATLPQDNFSIVAEVLIHSRSEVVSIQLNAKPH